MQSKLLTHDSEGARTDSCVTASKYVNRKCVCVCVTSHTACVQELIRSSDNLAKTDRQTDSVVVSVCLSDDVIMLTYIYAPQFQRPAATIQYIE